MANEQGRPLKGEGRSSGPVANRSVGETASQKARALGPLPIAGKSSSEALLTTGDMARLCSSTLRTVRFYEEEGLLLATTRSEGGHRMFDDVQRRKLELVLDLREAGLSLQSIKDLFALKSKCGSAEEASQTMSGILQRQIEEMHEKITKLRRLREELSSTISVISECQSCSDLRFPLRCGECEVLTRDDLPRAAKLLWS